MKLQELCGQELCRIHVRRGAWGKSAGSMSLPEAVATEAVGETYTDWRVDRPADNRPNPYLLVLGAFAGAYGGVVSACMIVWWLR